MTAALRQPLAPKRPGDLRVTEHYLCFEGEGRTLGALTYLVRLSGCDLRCSWCDSKQSSFYEDEARERRPAALEKAVLASGAKWASFTGGEPTWRGEAELKALGALCRRLRAKGVKVKVESNGRHLPKALDGAVDLWSVAPKWAPGGRRTAAMDYDEKALAALVRRHAPDALQLKFVIPFKGLLPQPADLKMAQGILKGLPPAAKRTPVFFIPEAYASGDYLARCRALEGAVAALAKGALKGFDLHVQPQLHRILHGDQRGR